MAEDKGSDIGSGSRAEELDRPKIERRSQNDRKVYLDVQLHQAEIDAINDQLRRGKISPEQHAELRKKIFGG